MLQVREAEWEKLKYFENIINELEIIASVKPSAVMIRFSRRLARVFDTCFRDRGSQIRLKSYDQWSNH